MAAPENIRIISNVSELESINGEASSSTLAKKIVALDAHAKSFIDRSPFLVLATTSSQGTDASPRGDAPGFVKCLDDNTLLIPERPGNRIADSLRNIVAQPEIGLLFLIPGMNETLRVNGQAWVTDHEPYRTRLAANGKTPALAIVMQVTELYFHCAKAFVRSDLWDPSKHMPRDEMPSLGRIILEQINGVAPDATLQATVDKALEEDIRDNLY